MLKTIERFGFTEGTNLEDKRLTKGIERAQRKVEERNFSARKHLLEWDEPMDYQRKEFYRSRQRILEERGLPELIFEIIDRAIDTNVGQFLAPKYARQCVAEWCRANLDVNIQEDDIDLDDLETTVQSLRHLALDEMADQIRTSLGEYVDPETPPEDWDVGGLLQWATRLFPFNISQNRLRKMEPSDIEDALYEAAKAHYNSVNLDGVAIFLERSYPQRALAEWARSKFNIKVEVAELLDISRTEGAALLRERVREAYREREVSYPVEFCLERAFGEMGTGHAASAEWVVQWANLKYRLGWTLTDVQGKDLEELRAKLVALNREYLTGERLRTEIREQTAGKEREAQIAWMKERCGPFWNQRMFDRFEGELEEALSTQAHEMYRRELTRLEQYVLLRIYDQAWKDHLLEMDHLKHAIMQRPLGGDQTHPQSQYAIEGRDQFNQMWARIADRVTDVVFKVRATGPTPPTGGVGATRTSGGPQGGAQVSFQHAESTGGGFALAARDREAAMRAQNVDQKIETIRRAQPKVGRNDPCPCGSGKKYKQCCGKR
ncbi:MAG TPA: SEC-C metal-binding domain-containing protein [Phycisphaerae bacterium]|nr:SEC-C metal-binding domain-containing protein [Phycisphaerae bacterium]HNU46471.1 SEC-C metal-binding domain-containing protein [Phycisphaerae bacterium]